MQEARQLLPGVSVGNVLIDNDSEGGCLRALRRCAQFLRSIVGPGVLAAGNALPASVVEGISVRPLVSFLLAAILGGVTARSAEGCLKSPRAFFSPRTWSLVPPDPTIFYFVPGRHLAILNLVAQATDAPGLDSLPIRVVRVSVTNAFTAYRIRVKTLGHTRFEIVGPPGLQAEYRVGPDTRTARRPGVTIADVTHRHLSLRRFQYHAADVELAGSSSDAMAYRLEWAETRDAYERGARTSLIFPAFESDFYRASAHCGTPMRLRASLQLGYVYCAGEAFYTDGRVIYAGVSALFADGSASPLPQEPREIVTARARKAGASNASFEFEPRDEDLPFDPPVPIPAAPRRAAVRRAAPQPPMTPAEGVILACVSLLGGLATGHVLARRVGRRRSVSHGPPP